MPFASAGSRFWLPTREKKRELKKERKTRICFYSLLLSSFASFLLSSFLPGQEAVRKLPVPGAAVQAKARGVIGDIFKEDMEAARGSADKVKLASALWQQAKDNNNDAVHRFVLLEEARDWAARGGDTRLALQIAEELANEFAVGLVETRVKALTLAASGVATAEANKDFVELVLPLLTDAAEADQYELALHLGRLAATAAQKTGLKALAGAVQQRNEEVRAMQQGFSRLQPFVDRLKQNAQDAEANLELGKYYCFFKGNWERALPLLARGNDTALKAQVLRDLANPKDAHAQLAVADGWWDLAAGEREPARLQLRKRARHWYDQALLNLSGLHRTKALKRSERIQTLLSGAASAGMAGPVGELKKFEGHQGEVRGVAFSPDGRFAASCGSDQTVRLWDLVSGKEERVLTGHTNKVWSIAFHPAQRYLLSASWDASVRFWDLKNGGELRRLTHPKDVNAVLISPDGNTIFTGSDDKVVRAWNAATGQEVRRYSGHGDYVLCLAVSPNQRLLTSGSRDRSIRLYDLATGQTVKVLEGLANEVPALAFTGDSRHLLSCGDDFARLWDVATGKEVRRFEGHAGRVTALALSPDGRRMLTGGDDKTVRLWDVATGKELAKFQGHTDYVLGVAFAADGRRALSSSLDRTVRLWGLPGR